MVKGYFTVEAALVFPIVLWIYQLLIYIMIFQYDRCILEQDIGILAFRGTLMQEEGNDKILQKMQEETFYLDKYILLQPGDVHIRVSGNRVCVSGDGKSTEDLRWMVKASYENRRTDPVLIIRTCRKIMKEE